MSIPVERTGRCNCGAVRFRTHGELREVIYCHCRQCRRQTGHFYAATSVDEQCLTLEASDSLAWYAASPDARRGFCGVCGSALFWRREGDDSISVLAGAFDAPTGLRGGSHIFLAEKGDYYDVADDLPRHEEW
jgi:hypothetical protein